MVTALTLVVVRSGAAVAREDVQTAVFPLLLIAVAALRIFPLRRELVLLLLIPWGFFALFVRGFLPARFYTAPCYIARLDGDQDGKIARGVYNATVEMAREYRLPTPRLLHRRFSSLAEAQSWLERSDQTAFLITGDMRWPTAISNSRFSFGNAGTSVKLAGTDIHLELVMLPRRFDLPFQPQELMRQYLPWLLAGISPASDDELARVNPKEFRSSLLREAVRVQGAWRSSVPRAVAGLLLGANEALETKAADVGTFECAKRALDNALTRVRENLHPEAAAAILNNLAVLEVVMATNYRELAKGRRIFIRAMQLDEDGAPTRGALAALNNLRRLETAGILAAPPSGRQRGDAEDRRRAGNGAERI